HFSRHASELERGIAVLIRLIEDGLPAPGRTAQSGERNRVPPGRTGAGGSRPGHTRGEGREKHATIGAHAMSLLDPQYTRSLLPIYLAPSRPRSTLASRL